MLGSTFGATLALAPGATRRGGCCCILFLYVPLTTSVSIRPWIDRGPHSIDSLRSTATRIWSNPSRVATMPDLFILYPFPLFVPFFPFLRRSTIAAPLYRGSQRRRRRPRSRPRHVTKNVSDQTSVLAKFCCPHENVRFFYDSAKKRLGLTNYIL